MKKRCSACHRHKRVELFDRNRRMRDGRANQCKSCFKRHKDKIKWWDRGGRTQHGWNHIKSTYGLSRKQYEDLWKLQGGTCACCARELLYTPTSAHEGHGPVVDHVDTPYFKVRGILCRLCNTGIGALGDDLSGVMRAVRYLEVRG